MHGSAYREIALAGNDGPGRDTLWPAVERLLSTCAPEDATAHGLGALDARLLRERGALVPEALEWEERWAALAMLTVVPLLERLRAACDGPLVLMKGAEIAVGYPDSARMFGDVDLLVPEPRRVHAQLQEAGFVPTGDPELFYGIHHLRPLQWPSLPLWVEIHSAPKWPKRLSAPSVAEIVEAAVPSALHVDGVLAPAPAQHALLVAAHAWAHEPLLRLRDLVDVRSVARSADPASIEMAAREWRLQPLWHTTDAAASAIFDGAPKTFPLRVWARHLPEVRERTVLENHAQQWLAGYWALPLRPALAATGSALLKNVTPAPEEGWRDKFERAFTALKNAATPLSAHNRLLGDAATRGQGRNPPDEEDLERSSGQPDA